MKGHFLIQPMKKSKYIYMLLALCLLCFFGEAKAQDAQDIRLGYCIDRLGSCLTCQSGGGQSNTLSGAIYLKPEILKKYVGDSIYQMKFAIGTKVGKMISVFVTKDLEGQPIRSKTIKDFTKGWNTIEFTGVKITESIASSGLYVGYTTYPEGDELYQPILNFEDLYGGTEGVNWYELNGYWNKTNVQQINCDLSICAFAKGPNKPQIDLGVNRIINYDMVKQNQPTTITLQVTNFGMETVNNFLVSAKYNGNTFATHKAEGLSLAQNEEVTLKLNDIAFVNDGNITFDIALSDINSKEDVNPDDNTKSSETYVVDANARPQSHTILFEQFNSENYKSSMDADSVYYNVSVKNRDDVIWVKHHLDDAYELSDAAPYIYFFENAETFVPAVMVDRMGFSDMDERGPAYFRQYGESLDEMFNSVLQVPCYVFPDLNLSYDEATRHLNVKVNVNSQVREMPKQTSLRLNVYAVEDGIESHTQTGADTYVQDGVLRKILSSSCWGDEISLDTKKAEKEYELTLPATWNADNMRIVAFVSNYDATNPLNCTVFNSNEQRLPTTGVHNVSTTDDAQAHVWSDNGTIMTNSGFSIVAVHNAAGQALTNASLPHGLYIVTVSNGAKTQNVKLRIQ